MNINMGLPQSVNPRLAETQVIANVKNTICFIIFFEQYNSLQTQKMLYLKKNRGLNTVTSKYFRGL